tara:strand:+ start:1768 stop:3354 length:1587 start_codon:yes stop_codon:yes gene_type:complete
MISIDTTPVKLILENLDWAEKPAVISYFLEQSKLVEDYILNHKEKSSIDILIDGGSNINLIDCKSYLEAYKMIFDAIGDKTEHDFKHDELTSALNSHFHKRLKNMLDDFLYSLNDGSSFDLLFSELEKIHNLKSHFEVDFSNLQITKEYLDYTSDDIFKKYFSSQLKNVAKSYSEETNTKLSKIKANIEHYGLTEYFQEEIDYIVTTKLEKGIIERLTKYEKTGNFSSLESAWEIERYLDNNPGITHISNTSIDEITQRVINMLIIYSSEERYEVEFTNFHNVNEIVRSKPEYFYTSLTFYPSVGLFKKQNGLNGLKLYGKKVTEELLEVLYSHALTKDLKNTKFNTSLRGDNRNIDYNSLVKHMNINVLRYLGYEDNVNFYTDFFKEKGSRAAVLRVLQAAYQSSKTSKAFNLACLKLIDTVLAECPNLTLEDFCLTEEIVAKIKADEITSKEAFAEAASAKWFDDNVMNKSHLITPKKEDRKTTLSKVEPLAKKSESSTITIPEEATEVNPGVLGKVGNFFKTNFL